MSLADNSLRTGSVRWLLSQVKLGNSHDREIVLDTSPGDSFLRTGSIWMAFVTGENVLDSQKCFITSYIVGCVITHVII